MNNEYVLKNLYDDEIYFYFTDSQHALAGPYSFTRSDKRDADFDAAFTPNQTKYLKLLIEKFPKYVHFLEAGYTSENGASKVVSELNQKFNVINHHYRKDQRYYCIQSVRDCGKTGAYKLVLVNKPDGKTDFFGASDDAIDLDHKDDVITDKVGCCEKQLSASSKGVMFDPCVEIQPPSEVAIDTSRINDTALVSSLDGGEKSSVLQDPIQTKGDTQDNEHQLKPVEQAGCEETESQPEKQFEYILYNVKREKIYLHFTSEGRASFGPISMFATDYNPEKTEEANFNESLFLKCMIDAFPDRALHSDAGLSNWETADKIKTRLNKKFDGILHSKYERHENKWRNYVERENGGFRLVAVYKPSTAKGIERWLNRLGPHNSNRS